MKWNPLSESQSNLIQFVINQSKDDRLDKVIIAAAEELKRLTTDYKFDGYASGKRGKVHAQVQAIYETVFKIQPKFALSIEPSNFAKSTFYLHQEVRSIEDIEREQRADCIDIVCLLASLLLRIGLNPVILTVCREESKAPNHAILGYWLENVRIKEPKLQWSDRELFLRNIAFLEATGVLEGHKLPFTFAQAEALLSLPKEDRLEIISGLRGEASEQGTSFLPAKNSEVYMMIDVKNTNLHDIPIIAIMGAKGGVGKTAISARIAGLIAETGKNVLVVDFDLEKDEGGISAFFLRRTTGTSFAPIKTVYDHFIRYSDSSVNVPFSDDLLHVTPPYLRQKGLGEICLIPALPRGVVGKWDVIANINSESKKRNEIIANGVEEIIQRARTADVNIGFILIDCGAGTNPIYSAAFSKANYAFIVAMPDPDSLRQINPIIQEHIARFPNNFYRKIDIILNRVATEKSLQNAMIAPWSAWKPIGIIPEDPKFQEDYILDDIYFDLGYDNFSLAIRSILEKAFKGNDIDSVPDEIDVCIRPWWDQLVNCQLAKIILKSRSFRLKTVLHRSLFAFSILATFLSAFFIFLAVSANSSAALNSSFEGSIIAPSFSGNSTLIFPVIQGNSSYIIMSGLNGSIIAPITYGNATLIFPVNSGNATLILSLASSNPTLLANTLSSIAVFCFIFSVVAVTFTFVKFRVQEKKKKLLVYIDKISVDEEETRKFLKDLLIRSREKNTKDALKWLRDLLNLAVKSERESERMMRLGVPSKEGKKF
jgi:MinD-like ATPase involved in chromosome partitioning or flagellar assembly